jgi:hypothetical protein
MERFWRSLESAQKRGVPEKLIADMVGFYNTTWTQGALKMTPQAACAAGIDWRAPNAVIDPTISNNVTWAPQSQEFSP